jgi:hypothetical protein
MTITAPPALTNPPTPPTRADPATFAARGDAFLSWLPTAWTNLVAVMAWTQARAQEVFDWANAAQADRIICAAAASNPAVINASANAAAAQAAASAAQIYASAAQATNPDSPIRLNPRRITADFTLASAYNAASVGPITISDGTTVTVGDNATWSIH